MKRLFSLAWLLAIMAALPAAAQVSIDKKELLGTWTMTKAPATLDLTLKKDNTYAYRIELNAAELQGSILVTWSGTWRTEADTLLQTMDEESFQVKYRGSNQLIGQQIEGVVAAHRKEMLEQAGFGDVQKEWKMTGVVVADNLLIFTMSVPQPDGTTKEEKIVMSKK